MKVIHQIKVALLVGLMFPTLGFGQDTYYYYSNEKIYLNYDNDYLSINVSDTILLLNSFASDILSRSPFSKKNIRTYLTKPDSTPISSTNLKNYYAELELADHIKNNNQNYTTLINQLNLKAKVIKVSPCFKTIQSNKRLGLTNNFYVKLNDVSDDSLLYNYVQNLGLEVLGKDPYMPKWYVISTTKNNSKNALEFANDFYESNLFAAAEPEFAYHNLQGSSDPLYTNQWGLKNTGQNNGVTDVDINVEPAWGFTKGNNVKVAIYDHGFELNHPDLMNNIVGTGYDAHTFSPPAQLRGIHGTPCAGIVGATQNNNIGTSGVAPEAELVPISISVYHSDLPIQIAGGFNWARTNGVDVISNSWGGNPPSLTITDAITDAMTLGRNGKGCVIVFLSGNDNNTNIWYPGSALSDIIVVGAISPCGERKHPSSCDTQNKDLDPGDGSSWGSCYGSQLDVVAPGVDIATTDRLGNIGYNTTGDYIQDFSGTSAACPHVAGVAALILSVRPDLTVSEVRDIIEQTAKKVNPTTYTYGNHANRPNGTWNNEMGYGLVDAHAAVVRAINYSLYIKDNPNDTGGSYIGTSLYNGAASPDIWARNQNDGFINQNHEAVGSQTYSSTPPPTYVYVRVRNNGDSPTLGNGDDKVQLAWAASSLYYPNSIQGFQNIGTLNIPVLQPGQSTILEFTWNMSFTLYTQWAFSSPALLASIESPHDVSIIANPPYLPADLYNNNNIAMKHVSILGNGGTSGTVGSGGGVTGVPGHSTRTLIGNPNDAIETYDLVFKTPDNYQGNPITQEAEVKMVFDDTGWSIVQPQIGNRSDIQIIKDKEILIKGTDVAISNLSFPANTMLPLEVRFNFLSDELSDKNEFNYQIIQKYSASSTKLPNQPTGDIHFIVRKESRNPFDADAGNDKEITKGDSIDLSAYDIGELAIYNWYDDAGNLIYTGKDLAVSPEITEKYKLEVIALDGVKDYAEVEVKVKEYEILNMTPNPTSNQVTIDYKVTGASSAYLMVLTPFSSAFNYILDINSNNISLDLSGFQTGIYTVLLVCDGAVSDSKSLIKQ